MCRLILLDRQTNITFILTVKKNNIYKWLNIADVSFYFINNMVKKIKSAKMDQTSYNNILIIGSLINSSNLHVKVNVQIILYQ